MWLTCVDPKMLVSKYGEYVHGNRLGTCRVVLDTDMLPNILATSDIPVTNNNELLDTFIGTVRTECRVAAQNNSQS